MFIENTFAHISEQSACTIAFGIGFEASSVNRVRIGQLARMDILEKVAAEFDTSLDNLEAALEPYLNVSLKTVSTKLTPLDNARLNASLATVVLSLSSAYLRTAGTDVKEHDVADEFATLKSLMQRITETQKMIDIKDGKQLSNIDIGAAQRFIKAGLAGNPDQQQSQDGGSASNSGAAAGAGSSAQSSSSAAGSKRKQDGSSTSSNPNKRRDGTQSADRADDSGSKWAGPSAGDTSGGGARKVVKKGVTVTPQADLGHNNWKAEMERKFGGAKK